MEIPRLNKVVSQRLIVSLVGIALIQASWRWAVEHLYTLPEVALVGFVTITTNTLYITGAIVIFLVTGRMVYDWRMGTNQIQEVVSTITRVNQDISERITHNAKEEDYETSIQ
jgi:hypothetical protein